MLTLSEAVETECGQGDPKMVERRRGFLEEVSLFRVHETISKVAKLLVVPGALPEKAGVDAIHIFADLKRREAGSRLRRAKPKHAR